ncbi:hypothetical protein L3X38_034687 [Prunus dulcis]|uniref:Uncharacterized protein n=1 Tax=Prunus dulcis TaxID=3755 RepID=A0AAD4YYS6_PRUDU|nr:hypothetical protein L3X38_034687 [Prunus dulcis]
MVGIRARPNCTAFKAHFISGRVPFSFHPQFGIPFFLFAWFFVSVFVFVSILNQHSGPQGGQLIRTSKENEYSRVSQRK